MVEEEGVVHQVLGAGWQGVQLPNHHQLGDDQVQQLLCSRLWWVVCCTPAPVGLVSLVPVCAEGPGQPLHHVVCSQGTPRHQGHLKRYESQT